FYRPALRYLVALALLAEDRASAEYYAGRLRRLEPDFVMAMLIQPDYPIETLRALGHVETLRDRLS
ncbi:MAG: SARP family transcriptional regulator, partial [Paracoccaceae bacterium]